MTLLCRCVLETVKQAEQNDNENENTAVEPSNKVRLAVNNNFCFRFHYSIYNIV